MREYIDSPICIDGRNIPYPVFTAADYLREHDRVADIDDFFDNRYEIVEYITQILALKQSCYLLRHTAYSCQSLSDGLFKLKVRLIAELKEKHGYEFDDAWMEQLIP